LSDYLKTVPADYDIVFAGHSMGGAIAPTVALGLVQAGVVPVAKTFILPSAGATPGNLALFQDPVSRAWVFPPGAPNPNTPYAVYNVDFYNTLDVVPQAWSNDPTANRNFFKIDTIYANAGPKIRGYIDNTVGTFMKKAQSSGIYYEPLPGNSFTGSDIPAITDPFKLPPQILLQHTTNYWISIDIKDYVDWISSIVNSPPGAEKLSVAGPANEDKVVLAGGQGIEL
jgi:hypothetical protein